jgi:hypothetical protein
MATKKTYWECDFCKRLYDDEGQVSECEKHHTMSHLTVIDLANANVDSNDLFPEKILLKNEHDDDHLAEYKLSRQGSIADFYQSEEQWSYDTPQNQGD